MAQATTVTPLDHLVKVLKLGEPSAYRNHTYINGESMYFPTGRVYGGQVIAQSVIAASKTVGPSRLPHSVHGYFIAAGDIRQDLLFDVENLRDGRSFSARRVNVTQAEGSILTADGVDEGRWPRRCAAGHASCDAGAWLRSGDDGAGAAPRRTVDFHTGHFLCVHRPFDVVVSGYRYQRMAFVCAGYAYRRARTRTRHRQGVCAEWRLGGGHRSGSYGARAAGIVAPTACRPGLCRYGAWLP